MEIEISNKKISKITFSDFKNELKTYQNKLEEINTIVKLKSFIISNFEVLINHFIALGNYSDHAKSNQSKDADILQKYLINYKVSEEFKNIILLHRDVYLELYKSTIYFLEKQISKKIKIAHFDNSKLVLIEALKDFNESINIQEKELTIKNNKRVKKIALMLSQQASPWDIYRLQYLTIINQIKEIEKSEILLIETISIYDQLKVKLDDVNKNHKSFIESIVDSINDIINNIKKNTKIDDLLKEVNESIIKNLLVENIPVEVNNLTDHLKKIKVPISSHDGLLSQREIDFKKQTQKWIDYQIIPDFMDLIGIESNLQNKYNHSLNNISNSLKLSKTESDTKFENLVKSLSNLNQEIIVKKNTSQKVLDSINNNVNNRLLVSELIKGNPFLEVDLNSSISLGGTTFIKNIKNSLAKGNIYFNSQYKKSLRHQSLTNFEMSLQCIAHRMYREDSTHYDALFLNKNFIGDLFLVARQEQENALKLILEQWHIGFNKSVLIYGDRLSGRSTFLDYTSKKFFGKHIVNLKPNSNATIDGRKFKTTYNLKDALIYLKNNNLKSTKPVIIIDDIELWRDDNNSLLNNIRSLINFIETESDNAFVMISTTTLMLEHLNVRLNFSNAISHTINVNKAYSEEITEAILRRHGAAHRNLVTDDLKPISTTKIKSISRKLSKLSDYNIGNTLQAWTYNTFVKDNENVILEDSYYEFFDFFTPQEMIILKQALVFKTISEFGLKKVTSLTYDLDFQPAISRLTNIKVLIRDTFGKLYINPIVVNDITKIAKDKTIN